MCVALPISDSIILITHLISVSLAEQAIIILGRVDFSGQPCTLELCPQTEKSRIHFSRGGRVLIVQTDEGMPLGYENWTLCWTSYNRSFARNCEKRPWEGQMMCFVTLPQWFSYHKIGTLTSNACTLVHTYVCPRPDKLPK